MKRRAISPVIATLLLIVIAVAAAVLAYIWIIGYQGTLTQQASAQQLQEKIKIEAVSYSADTNTLSVYVRNIGDISVTIASAYVLNPSGTAIATTDFTSNNELQPGQLLGFSITGVSLQPGYTYVAKVVTKSGTEATYTWTYRT
ncbi:flagellar biosynthesis protein FlaG [Infirmifilum lucidum]|uniref:Flagellar biosynthesis protein FlaG n=1 Tax=Infirmifilum lucidum TaxID=2776706 RepID=A0A7L9FJ07_9CREN|nr:archaellin/type IV pilin N-terminal domain-containing protein [Infirmifilum lucidum]QOJ78904.1 flagellar biosynthesis protein FlaG [Infirmifilum lucidum]